MMIDIKELRRLAEAATPGPWQDGGHTVYEAEGSVNCPEMICKMMSIEDSAYIAASNPSAILSLLDHIEQQEAEIVRLHSSLAGAVQHGEQGWQRYESSNRMCINQQNEIAGLNAEIARLRKDAWREMESAPKDGTRILLFWISQDSDGSPLRNTVVIGCFGMDNRWHIEDSMFSGVVRHESMPTKWKPLSVPDTSTQEVG